MALNTTEDGVKGTDSSTGFDRLFVRSMLESALRIGLVFLLLVMTYDIISPFVVPLMWGGIIAIAAFPLVKWLEPRLGGRRGMASTLVSLAFILLLVVPSFMLTESLLGSIKNLAATLEAGELRISAPPAKVADIPVIGEKVYAGWALANENLEAAITQVKPQLKELTGKMVRAVGSGLLGVLMFVISLIIAGALMAYAESTGTAAQRFFVRLGGEKPGGEWASLCVATVRSVLQGVVGVAVIQAALAAIGLVVMGIPAAAVWCAIILFFAIAQLPAILIIGPIVAWAFTAYEGTPATVFAVWMILAALSDNVLKPMLMGRGLDIPMPIILLGAIGGMMASGIIGLFAGAVILSIWYKLFSAWLEQGSA
ncbi:MAG: AI-2E family transporter [Halieaceae bacterium]|jgi:predicted PurR-regulated permease PerM|nr:AI-2E family transporter [Halieaceae bacterium]